MKTIIKYVTFLIFTILIFSACNNNEGSQSVFGYDELPKIFFTTWAANQSVVKDSIISYSPFVSPADGATYKWTLDGVVISTEKNLKYKAIKDIGAYDFRFDVERHGLSTYRKALLNVTDLPSTTNVIIY